jgi:PAS domain S-box-containing protein
VVCDIRRATGRASFESALAQEAFDLIISDYNLPGYDGIAALKQAQKSQPDVPVILVSGTVSEEQAVRCLHMGATDYLLKDRLERLGPAVERAIQEAETRLTRKQAEVELAQSERRKAAILDSVLDCIITMDAHGVVIEFNAAAERTFGYTKAQAIGRPLADLIIPERFRHAHAAGLARYLATGEAHLLGKIVELTAMRSDGSELPVEVAITAIHSEKAPIFTGVLRDITKRKKGEDELERLNDEIQLQRLRDVLAFSARRRSRRSGRRAQEAEAAACGEWIGRSMVRHRRCDCWRWTSTGGSPDQPHRMRPPGMDRARAARARLSGDAFRSGRECC